MTAAIVALALASVPAPEPPINPAEFAARVNATLPARLARLDGVQADLLTTYYEADGALNTRFRSRLRTRPGCCSEVCEYEDGLPSGLRGARLFLPSHWYRLEAGAGGPWRVVDSHNQNPADPRPTWQAFIPPGIAWYHFRNNSFSFGPATPAVTAARWVTWRGRRCVAVEAEVAWTTMNGERFAATTYWSGGPAPRLLGENSGYALATGPDGPLGRAGTTDSVYDYADPEFARRGLPTTIKFYPIPFGADSAYLSGTRVLERLSFDPPPESEFALAAFRIDQTVPPRRHFPWPALAAAIVAALAARWVARRARRER